MERTGQIINLPQNVKPAEPTTTKAKAFDIKLTSNINLDQYNRTIQSFTTAGMSYEGIANAAISIGDNVQVKEIYATLQSTSSKVGEVITGENKTMAWQNIGEQITVNFLPQATAGTEIIPGTGNVVEFAPKQEQKVNVIEGIALSTDQPANLPQNDSISNNPYLRAPADISVKKAA